MDSTAVRGVSDGSSFKGMARRAMGGLAGMYDASEFPHSPDTTS